MRVIEQAMIAAILSPTTMTRGNTRVVTENGWTQVLLHGHLIARIAPVGESHWRCQITLAGWNTPTTRSRVSALCHAFSRSVRGVGTKDGLPRLVYSDRAFKPIGSNDWVEVTE